MARLERGGVDITRQALWSMALRTKQLPKSDELVPACRRLSGEPVGCWHFLRTDRAWARSLETNLFSKPSVCSSDLIALSVLGGGGGGGGAQPHCLGRLKASSSQGMSVGKG